MTVLEPWYDGWGVSSGWALQLQLLPPGHGETVRSLHNAGRGLHPELRLLANRLPVHVPCPALVAALVPLLQACKLQTAIFQYLVVLSPSVQSAESVGYPDYLGDGISLGQTLEDDSVPRPGRHRVRRSPDKRTSKNWKLNLLYICWLPLCFALSYHNKWLSKTFRIIVPL